MKIDTQSLVTRSTDSYKRFYHGIYCLVAIFSSVLLPTALTFAQANQLVVAKVASSPVIDGVADDAAWRTAKPHEANDGSEIWITRPEDSGDSVEKKQDAPTRNEGERVQQYLPGTPSGSAADVGAKGKWADGWWTVEFARKLDTGEADDTTFSPDRCYRMAVATFDRTGDMDKASELIVLRLDGAKAVECPASQ